MKSHDMPVSVNPIISIIRGIKSIYQKFNGNDIIIILYHAIPKIPSSDPIISYPLIPSKLIQKCGGRARRGTGGHMKYQYLNVVTVLYIYISIYIYIHIYISHETSTKILDILIFKAPFSPQIAWFRWQNSTPGFTQSSQCACAVEF